MSEQTVEMNPSLKLGLELDAICERYWNEITVDGWSWVEMITGHAGNNAREREVGLEQADEIRAAMMAAIAPLVAERDTLTTSLAAANAGRVEAEKERDEALKEARELRPGAIMFQELAPVLAKMGVLT